MQRLADLPPQSSPAALTSDSSMNPPPPAGASKRKRSPSEHLADPRPAAPSLPIKPPSTSASASRTMPPAHQLQINYLVRSNDVDLPLINDQDTLPGLVQLIDRYEEVLRRQESMAANLGAMPLSQTLIKRFVRMFDGPVKVVSTGAKGSLHVDWVDVIDFAATNPDDFNNHADWVPSKNGSRVCHFYIKQAKVEIAEDDYSLIASGIPQKMIPRQPIDEDEEKEHLTLEILDESLTAVIKLTDAVSGKARQLKYRLNQRRQAIAARRAKTDKEASLTNGGPSASSANNGRASSHSPTQGFVAVNSGSSSPGADTTSAAPKEMNGVFHFSTPSASTPAASASPSHAQRTREDARADLRADLVRRFASTSSRQHQVSSSSSSSSQRHQSRPSADRAPHNNSSTSHHYNSTSSGGGRRPSARGDSPALDSPRGSFPATQHGTPYNNGNHNSVAASHSTPSGGGGSGGGGGGGNTKTAADAGPYRAEMARRIEALEKNERIYPPCDRCRRLSIICTKNLTACQGCTKKHARCAWKEVRAEEMEEEVDDGPEEGEEEAEKMDVEGGVGESGSMVVLTGARGAGKSGGSDDGDGEGDGSVGTAAAPPSATTTAVADTATSTAVLAKPATVFVQEEGEGERKPAREADAEAEADADVDMVG